MKRKGIKNLIFDFGGVLINLDRQRCIENFRKLGLEKVDELLGMYSQQGIFMQHEKGLISSAQFRDSIRGQITQEVTDEQIDTAWNSFLVDIPRFKLDMSVFLPREAHGQRRRVGYTVRGVARVRRDSAAQPPPPLVSITT